MNSLLFILISSLSYASSDRSNLSTSQYASTDKTDKQAWTVSEEDAPQDEVYSQSDVIGTLGLSLTELDTDELDTGSATAHSDVEDSGSGSISKIGEKTCQKRTVLRDVRRDVGRVAH